MADVKIRTSRLVRDVSAVRQFSGRNNCNVNVELVRLFRDTSGGGDANR